jgi:myo-inositol-1(or 4)-monophosphatase
MVVVMKDADRLNLLQLIEAIATEAGRQARVQWGQPRQLAHKGFRDIVTDADITTQKLITEKIRRAFPEHGFLTEEEDSDLPAQGPVIWIIDPIDGTTNFSRNLPSFCVSIAAVANLDAGVLGGQVLAGAVYDPMRDELFSAALGHGATLLDQDGRRRPLKVSSVSEMQATIVGLDWSREPELRNKALASLSGFAHEVHTIRAIGAAALALAWIAAGRLDGYMNYSLRAWDVAAGYLLINEAGGQLCQISGLPWRWPNGNGDCVASNGLIHQQFMKLIG